MASSSPGSASSGARSGSASSGASSGSAVPAVLRTAVPPGWIELKAIEDDEQARQWFDELLDLTPGLYDEAGRASLHEVFQQARAQVALLPVDAAGAFFTVLEEDRPTLWAFTLTQVPFPESRDINVMAVVERFLSSQTGRQGLGPDDVVETFQTQDGRDGVAIYTTGSVDPSSGRVGGHIPQLDADALGVVYGAVRLPRLDDAQQDVVLVVSGVAPTLEERPLMALIAANLTVHATLQHADEPMPPGRVAVDAAGVVESS